MCFIKFKAFSIADEKPLIVSVCNLNEGKTMQDAMGSAPKAAGTINEVLGTNIGSICGRISG